MNAAAGISSALIGRFFSSVSNLSIVFFTGEFFPTLLRNTGVCIVFMTSRIGSVLMPFLVFAGEEYNGILGFINFFKEFVYFLFIYLSI